jgi:hypothetical protein
MGQFSHVGYLVAFQAKNLAVLVTDDPMPAPVMLVMTRQQYNDVMAKNPGAITKEVVMVDDQGRVKVPVNHAPISVARDFRFPPDAGKWMRTPDGDIILGCPKCSAQYSLKAPPFALRPDGYLEPSFICEKCKLHVLLQFEDIRPDPEKCTTCGCTNHSEPCKNPKGGKPCGCVVGTDWEPAHVDNWPPSEMPN